MYKDSKRTCIAIVLLIKPFVWRRSRRRRRRGLLKLPFISMCRISREIIVRFNSRTQFLLLYGRHVCAPPKKGSQAQNTWCMPQLVYIENCMGKSPIVKKKMRK